jgi:hypothetical protein
MNHSTGMITPHNGLFTALDKALPALIHGFDTPLWMNRQAGRSELRPQRSHIAPGRNTKQMDSNSTETAAMTHNNRSDNPQLVGSDTPQGIATLTDFFTSLMESEAE